MLKFHKITIEYFSGKRVCPFGHVKIQQGKSSKSALKILRLYLREYIKIGVVVTADIDLKSSVSQATPKRKRTKKSKAKDAFTLLKTLHNKGLDRPARNDKERVFFLVIKIFDFAGLSIWYPIRGLSIKQKSIRCNAKRS